MKTLTFLRSFGFALILSLLGSSAQAQVKQTRNVKPFRAVSAGGAVNVFLTQGNETKVVVEAAEEIQANLITEVQGGVLKIHRDKDFNWKNLKNYLGDINGGSKVNIYITCPKLESLSVSGASDVSSESVFAADHFTVQASGASEIVLKVKAKTLSVSSSGASDIKLSGEAESQQVNLSGSSEYSAFNLQSKTTQVDASGASEAYVLAENELTSSASGASDIYYKGNARVINKKTSGGSDVRLAK